MKTGQSPAGTVTPLHRGKQVAELKTFTKEEIELIRRTQLPEGGTDDDLQLLLYYSRKTGLDPILRQVYLSKRKGRTTPQATIDGFRLAAERTSKYRGQTVPLFCGEDGAWTDAWTSNKPPVLAKVGILREGFKEPVFGVARYDAYVQRNYEGKILETWTKMPETMLAKTAEALGYRKAFPDILSGIYTDDEMGFIENEDPDNTEPESPSTPPSSATPAPARTTPTPKSKDDTPGSAKPDDGRATEEQIKRLWALAQKQKLNVVALTAECNKILGTTFGSPREMSIEQAEQVIKHLETLNSDQPEQTTTPPTDQPASGASESTDPPASQEGAQASAD